MFELTPENRCKTIIDQNKRNTNPMPTKKIGTKNTVKLPSVNSHATSMIWIDFLMLLIKRNTRKQDTKKESSKSIPMLNKKSLFYSAWGT